MNTSLRIQSLVKQAKAQGSTTYWDLCCDHAYIAEALALELQNKKIIGVDMVEDIIHKTKDRLKTKYTYIPSEEKFLIASSQCKILLENSKNITPNFGDTIILAGIGGVLCAEIVKSILTNHQTKNLFWIFCVPQQKQQLRKFLMESDFDLELEELVCENSQFHEIISGRLNNQKPKNPITFFGGFWRNCHEHHKYHEKLLKHYSNNNSDKFAHEHKLLKDIKFLD